MRNDTKKQLGFSAVEALLLLVIVAMIGFSGWYVWHAKQNADKTLTADKSTVPIFNKKKSTSPSSTSSTTAAQSSNACGIVTAKTPAGWETYTNSQYKYSISYPSNWRVATSGGAENNSSNTPILTELEFTPAGSQGSEFGIEVTSQTLADAITDLKNSNQEAQQNDSGSKFTIINQATCTYGGNSAARIDTKQTDSTGTVYDGEFYVSANGYAYKFSTGFDSSTSNPFKDATILSIVESLAVKH